MGDQFNFRVPLGKVSKEGYDMMFEKSNKEYIFNGIKGHGCYVNNSSISEFYSPYIPDGYDFLNEIGRESL